MNEEIDESEFYHQDFTTASEWELFISRMEQIFHEWKMEDAKNVDNEIPDTKWVVKTENILFSDVEFRFCWYRCKSLLETRDCAVDQIEERRRKNPIDTNFDFVLEDGDNSNPDKCIAVWYGLKEYLLLAPTKNAVIVSESKMKILLSSANIAISNLRCDVPIFVQIREKWQKLYLGVYEGTHVKTKTNYDMIHLRRAPQHCKYLSGLLDLFKTKILSPVQLPAIHISAQLSYNLTDFGRYVWKRDNMEVDDENFESSSLTALPFGVTYDPISCLVLKTKWSAMPDFATMDTENYTDFKPVHSRLWTLSSQMTEQPVSLLAECLTEFLHLHDNNSTIQDILGDYAVTTAPENNPLDLLTEPHIPTLSTVLKRATRHSFVRQRKGGAPLSEDNLVPLLYFLFPDAIEEPTHPYVEKLPKENANTTFREENTPTTSDLFRGYKTCENGSLVWRLSITLAQALDTLGGVRALAHLWFEFVQEMRYRWEKTISIPGLSSGFPDPRTCLLHQKLQMLNCCIERKASRESEPSKSSESMTEETSSSTDDEEFFDCDTNPDEETPKRQPGTPSVQQPSGRLGKFENLKLIGTGEPLYIPVTQEPVPKTEDQLEEDTDVLLKLGSDAQGSELRAKMMSASLSSDMDSFKAANPNAILEDFIRWYSPRDWIEEDELDEWGQKKGHLSQRMLISDNTWVEIWKNAKSIPAHRQKRLFDDTREAEKVLHFLNSRHISQIIDLLLPVLIHVAIYRLAEEFGQIHLPESTEEFKQIVKGGERISREGKTSKRRCEVLLQEMATFELTISQVNSLLYKFNPSGVIDEDLNAVVQGLISGREMVIKSGEDETRISERLLSMFSDAQRAMNLIVQDYEGENRSQHTANSPFPPACEREFVLRVPAHRPHSCSVKSPQFMRAILSKNEFRVAAAFSEDLVFF